MELNVIGKIISIVLLFGSGVVLAVGSIVYTREKNVGIDRIQLLVSSIATFLWAFCFGCIGFCSNETVASLIRIVGVLAIDGFVMIDTWIVTDLSKLKKEQIKVVKYIYIILYTIDFLLFSRPGIDKYYRINDYMTWYGEKCFARTYHNILVSVTAIIMALLGISVYRVYKYKRQKAFLKCFYIANLVLFAACSLDTFLIDKFALPTSGIGAMICDIILIIGIERHSAYGVSLASIFDQIYDNISDGVLVVDVDRTILYANPYSLKLMGVKEYRGKTLEEFLDITNDNLDNYFESVKYGEVGMLKLNLKGSKIKSLCRLIVVRDKYLEPFCYIMTMNDMTSELNMLADLQKANAAKSHFLTSVSHEIRTPINAVLGMNEMIRRGTQNEEIISYTSKIDKSGHQLLGIINDILDYSKIESGKMELYNISYDVSSLIHDSYNTVVDKARDKGIEYSIKVNPDIPSWLYGDAVRISQVVYNLLSNAVKYTDSGFVMWECDYETIDEATINLIISVRDSGRGMKNVANSGLFESFNKLDEGNDSSIEGIGLGLSITKSLVDFMGGKVSVNSIYGVGSRFTISIPQKIHNLAPIGNIEERMNEADKEYEEYHEMYKAPDARILAVDDIQMNLYVIEELLKFTEMKIESVTGGLEALQKCKEKKYDLILMDHMMPGMDGIECLHKLRGSENINKSTPVIVLTANAVVGMKDMYLKEGFDDYLSKPIEGFKLEASIKKFLPKEKIV